MWRRDFLKLFGGAAMWPLPTLAQQSERIRRIGVLMAITAGDPQSQIRVVAFEQRLQQLGWTIGRNVRVDYRWSGGNADVARKYAAELIALGPDLVVAHTTGAVASLVEATHTVPIIFAVVADPVGAGYVESLSRPRGKRHRLHHFRLCICGEMVGAAQRNFTQGNEGSGPSDHCDSSRTCPVQCNPGDGSGARRGVTPGWRGQCR